MDTPAGMGRDEPRVAVLADIESPGGVVRVAATHLSVLPLSSGTELRRRCAASAGVLARPSWRAT